MIMRAFLLSPIPIFLSIVLFSLFSWPKISRTIWAKIGRILSVLLFLSSIATWYSALNAKVDAGRQGYHGVLVSKVTNHVEQLMNAGKYSEAKNVLEQFNKDYPIISKHLDELETFVDKLLDQRKEPANKALKGDAAKGRAP
jgi:hypothetical protein